MRSYAIYEVVKELTPKKQRKDTHFPAYEYRDRFACILKLVREVDIDTCGRFDFDENYGNVSFENSLPFCCPPEIKILNKDLGAKKVGEKVIIRVSGNTRAYLNYSVVGNAHNSIFN